MSIPTHIPDDPNDFFALVAKTLASELKQDSSPLAATLFGAGVPGYQNVSDDRLLEIAGHRWADPNFRQRLLIQIGDEKFLQIGSKLGYYIAPPSVKQIEKQVKQNG